jgi:hypothetical protein
MAKEQERALRLRLHRINMLAASLEVNAPPKSPQALHTSFGGPIDTDRRYGMLPSKGQGKKKGPFNGYMV